MYKILAFEGSSAAADGITWGAAAIDTGDGILNSFNGIKVSYEALNEILEREMLIAIQEPLQLDETVDEPLGILVVRVVTAALNDSVLKQFRKLAKRHFARADGDFFIFANRAEFDSAANKVVSALLSDLIYNHWNDTASATSLIRMSFTLNSSNPIVNAIWAFRNHANPLVMDIALANIAGVDNALYQFEKVLAGLRKTIHERFELEYTGGQAATGGFELPITSSILTSLQSAYLYGAEQIKQTYHLFRDIKPFETRERVAASVHWRFSLGDTEEPFGDRLARVMVLNEICDGLMQTQLQDGNRRAHRAFQVLVNPAIDVNLTLRFDDETGTAFDRIVENNNLRWSKRLSLTDAQVPTNGGYVSYLRLTKGDYEIDHHTWFHDVLFGECDWRPGTWNGNRVDKTVIRCMTIIDGICLGEMRYTLTHDPQRPASGNSTPPTWIHWNPNLLTALRTGSYGYHWVWLERSGTTFQLSIEALPPPWRR